jgi:mRNA interferase MazF
MNKDDKLELTLCPICASQFYNSNEHYIKRRTLNQETKEKCCYCNVRDGYDFLIYNKSKNMKKERRNI